ncbi:GM12584 [Drosophila sechellia]|uniref:GM12584 n=1 Tax=Drosophila sechellia TaxID=7238 RepID=B4I0D0_DROSE|nr:GM12584 [Drosophila sechellia]
MSKEIRLATVNEHNKGTDLWIVIDNKVYDVTKFRLEFGCGHQEESPISCRHVALALGAAFIGISLVYVIRRGVARN